MKELLELFTPYGPYALSMALLAFANVVQWKRNTRQEAELSKWALGAVTQMTKANDATTELRSDISHAEYRLCVQVKEFEARITDLLNRR